MSKDKNGVWSEMRKVYFIKLFFLDLDILCVDKKKIAEKHNSCIDRRCIHIVAVLKSCCIDIVAVLKSRRNIIAVLTVAVKIVAVSTYNQPLQQGKPQKKAS